MEVCLPCGKDPEAPAPVTYPPPKWRDVIVDGKKKRKCEWVDEDGNECPATVTGRPSNFATHWRLHTGEKPFKCNECEMAYATTSALVSHKRSRHTYEKPFECDECGKTFAQATHLQTHKRKHTGQRPYKCGSCDLSFKTPNNLHTHQSVHTGERKYKCEFEGCGMSFSQIGNRNAHMRIHTLENPYECKKCDATFKKSDHLSVHVRAVHDGIICSPCKGQHATNQCPLGRSQSSKYDGHCVHCFVSNFPNDPRADQAKKYLHAKELTVRAFLQETFPQYRWVFDRTCAVGELVRPDARTVLSKTRILIVEVDEESHNTYVCGDERERERIFKKHAPKDAIIHLIRFNPDAYDDPVTGKRVPTCFRFSKEKALVTVDPKHQADWDHRLATLRSTIQEIIDYQHEDIAVPECIVLDEADDDRHKYVIPIELFYDNVREKWPDGNKQRLAALKRNAQRR